jgi:hypothetical protein
MDYAEFQRIKKADRHAHRNAVKAFVEGVRTGDFELFWSGLELVEQHCVFKAAFRAVAKHSAAMEFRNRFSGVWQLLQRSRYQARAGHDPKTSLHPSSVQKQHAEWRESLAANDR